MTDPKFLELIRAAIAAKQIPKKVLARRCKVNRPTFSYFIHGDKEMPEDVKAKRYQGKESYTYKGDTVKVYAMLKFSA